MDRVTTHAGRTPIMFVRTITLTVALLLVGCATQPEIRIAEVPEPPVLQRPDLPVLNIQPGDDAGSVLQAHRETILVLQAYIKQLEAYLNAYRKDKK